MSERILHSKQEIITNQQATKNDHKTQKLTGGFYPQAQNKIKQLDELEAGQTGLIVSIKAKTPENSQMLMAMGISSYAVVRMINNYPHHIIFKIDHRKFAADKEIGAMIFIQPV